MRWLGWTILVIILLVLWDVAWWLGFGVAGMSPWSLKRMVDLHDAPLIIDVRTPAEYRSFHIPGAVNVPWPATLAELAYASPDPNAPVAVVGLTGHRSPQVARQMAAGGYTDVANVPWGMLAWKLMGGEVVEGDAPGPLPEP
ncbi:MAG: rhodanese-like domain-containing protein [Pseudodesulfovibrio sp.]